MSPPEVPAGALAPLVRALPDAGRTRNDGWISADLNDGLRLIASIDPIGPHEWTWITAGCAAPAPATVSRSSARGWRAMLVALAGRAGTDLETLDRVALNASPEDDWLAAAERTLVAQAPEPVLELACHWVLKEAYGKALGLGLALSLDALAFGGRDGTIVAEGAAAPAPDERWRYALYRQADTLLAVAHQRAAQAMPLAPAGRNPPMPLLDR